MDMNETGNEAFEAETAKLIVLRSSSMGNETDAIIVSEAVWTPCYKGSKKRDVTVRGRMVDQEVAHNWFEGRDMNRLDSQKNAWDVRCRWAKFWRRHPERTYIVPASQIAYTEVLKDESPRIGLSIAEEVEADD